MIKTLLITKAVSDGNRVRVLMALMHQKELCACHIAEMLKISAPTVSRHMGLLQIAGLVTTRKASRWVHYRLADETREPAMLPLINWLADSLATDPTILQDRIALEHIADCDTEQKNCKHYKNNQK